MISNLARKYDINLEAPEERAEVPLEAYTPSRPLEAVSNPWEEFPSVVALSQYLKDNKHHGIELLRQDGQAVLHFNPPRDVSDTERTAAATKAVELYCHAFGDLEFLINHGLLPLRPHPGYH